MRGYWPRSVKHVYCLRPQRECSVFALYSPSEVCHDFWIMIVDLFTADLNVLSNDARYSVIADFARAQPTESNRHDFKTLWNNETLKDVAAFANTFGGVLVIGVQKGQTDVEATLVGVNSTSELSTGIASAIATNISPNPSCDIVECFKPNEPTIRFCVVRIRNDGALHLVTKKGVSNPVWYRNADQTISADAAQLRMLIDREKQAVEDVERKLQNQAKQLFSEMRIGSDYRTLEAWPMGNFSFSETTFKLALVPMERRLIRLDLRSENEFLNLIHRHYRRISFLLGRNPPVAVSAVNRSSEMYEYRWYHGSVDHEARWRITNALEIAHATQVNEDKHWSLVDVVVYVVLMLTISAKWWESLKYFGEGVLFAELNVPTLQLARGSARQFTKLFGPGQGDYGLNPEVLDEHPLRSSASASIAVNFASMRDGVPQVVTTLMNSVLRSLGHGVSWDEFEEAVDIIAKGSV